MPPELFQLLLEKGVGKAVKPTEELVNTTVGNRLPAEVMDMVRCEQATATDGLISVKEAREHRLALIEERSVFVTKNK